MRRLFEDASLRPDMMKVYPTLVVAGTALERLHLMGRYSPYPLETVVDLLSDVKAFVPRWHRIMRIQREIPANEISGGVRSGNLRELVLARAREKGHPCQCIRCREVALVEPLSLEKDDQLRYAEERYEASGGTEVFGSFETEKSGKIAGFARLRFPSAAAHRPELKGSAVVRELRVYGRAVGIGERRESAWQHRGIGTALLRRMENAARGELGTCRIMVISAVGTREYYKRLGYRRLGPYMAKML
jgi:elongator complex protein 3